MKYSKYIVSLVITVTCIGILIIVSKQTPLLNASKNEVSQVIIDTILEKNTPANLDLTKHQLYIDTTRTSENFQKLINWNQR
ncbi:hypothetical protein Y10_03560 [Neptunitalea sp. Y10]|uniref:Uncharacterized protein n=1 Tax=Neptunitalea lumnitzerae TaxID=2965509 RepID=A0ABQ5MF26_9FLAO|nr:hypothetical protein Y10_03560 [Neptunitalea sp. Y10]